MSGMQYQKEISNQQCELSRKRWPQHSIVDFLEVKVGVELEPWFAGSGAHVEDPAWFAKIRQIESSNSDHHVKDSWDRDEVFMYNKQP